MYNCSVVTSFGERMCFQTGLFLEDKPLLAVQHFISLVFNVILNESVTVLNLDSCYSSLTERGFIYYDRKKSI